MKVYITKYCLTQGILVADATRVMERMTKDMIELADPAYQSAREEYERIFGKVPEV